MRKVLFGLTLLIATTAVKAQHAEFGIKGGLNASKFSNESGSDYKLHPSFHVGILEHIHITKSFAIQPEVMYSGQGTKFSTGNADSRFNLGYINVPVLFQLMTKSGFRFETGPQIGFLVNAKAKTGSIKTDIKSSFKSTDFAWAFGVGYITPSKFGFDIRYNAGIADISKSNESNVKNNVIQAGVFYQFHH
jgi:Outer membrane protein beta-barrel domain